MAAPYYPNCSGCGHNASGVVADCCTTFVPYPVGDPRGHAGYCGHRCTSDPVITAWRAGEPVAVPARPDLTGPLAIRCTYCRSGPGRPCRVGCGGQVAARPHKVRREGAPL